MKKLFTNARGTWELLDGDKVCPFCHSPLYRTLGGTGRVTLACFDNGDCHIETTASDIESALELLAYNFETRDIPAITPQDTRDEFDR